MKQKVVLMLGLLLLVFAAACGAAATPPAPSREALPPQPPVSGSDGSTTDQSKSLPGAVPAQAPAPDANPAGAARRASPRGGSTENTCRHPQDGTDR